jgi:hypothetical protein
LIVAICKIEAKISNLVNNEQDAINMLAKNLGKEKRYPGQEKSRRGSIQSLVAGCRLFCLLYSTTFPRFSLFFV